MMPKNHFQDYFKYYDLVSNSSSSTSTDPCTLFHSKEKKYQIKKYMKVLEITRDQLYECKFEKEEHNFFPSKNQCRVRMIAV